MKVLTTRVTVDMKSGRRHRFACDKVQVEWDGATLTRLAAPHSLGFPFWLSLAEVEAVKLSWTLRFAW